MLLFDNTASLGGLLSLKAAIYSIAAGVFLAIFAYWFLQNVVGKLVRRIAKRAVGEENAKTLDELSRNNWLYRYLLRDNSTLRRLISCVGDTLPRITDKEEGSVLDAIAEESKAESKDEVKATLVDAQPETKERAERQWERQPLLIGQTPKEEGPWSNNMPCSAGSRRHTVAISTL